MSSKNTSLQVLCIALEQSIAPLYDSINEEWCKIYNIPDEIKADPITHLSTLLEMAMDCAYELECTERSKDE